MTTHDHATYVPGCYRCELGRDEAQDALMTEAREAVDALREVVSTQAIRHPLPWRIESDWTEEVVASDGYCIAKCMKREDAQTIIDVASELDDQQGSATGGER